MGIYDFEGQAPVFPMLLTSLKVILPYDACSLKYFTDLILADKFVDEIVHATLPGLLFEH